MLGSQLWDPLVVVVELAETVGLAEDLSALGTFGASLAESVSLSEALSTQATLEAALAESVPLSEALGALRAVDVALSEGLSLSEALAGQREALVALAEGLALAEGIGGEQAFGAALAESLDLLELVEAGVLQGATLAETVTLAELLTALAFRARGRRTLSERQTARTLTDHQPPRSLSPMSSLIYASEQGSVDYTILEDGAPKDLTGLAVSVVVVHRQTRARDERAVTVLDALAGTVRAIWPAGTLAPGKYDLQILLTPPGGEPTAWPRPGSAALTVQAAL